MLARRHLPEGTALAQSNEQEEAAQDRDSRRALQRWAPAGAAVEAVARLAAVHGLPSPPARKSILDSLVRTILSQNTTDKTSAVAFARLKEGLPTWSSVLDAPEGVAEELVRCGGLAEVKMERVRAILRDDRVRTDSEPSLEWLHSKPDEEVKAVLTSFKGVGPKTVACVMMFTMGRAEFPVDTHVLHIAKKLGWLPADASREQAYEHLNRRVPNECKLDLHVLLVEHGKCCAQGAPRTASSRRRCAVDAAARRPILDARVTVDNVHAARRGYPPPPYDLRRAWPHVDGNRVDVASVSSMSSEVATTAGSVLRAKRAPR